MFIRLGVIQCQQIPFSNCPIGAMIYSEYLNVDIFLCVFTPVLGRIITTAAFQKNLMRDLGIQELYDKALEREKNRGKDKKQK